MTGFKFISVPRDSLLVQVVCAQWLRRPVVEMIVRMIAA